MAVDCNPNALMEAAKCFRCIPASTQLEVQTYLLAQIAGGSTDPNTLAQQAKVFATLNPITLQEIQAYLLCQIVNK